MKIVQSPRAQAYLRSLERELALPTQAVASALDALGWHCEPWLSFHENYAGYIERVGKDTIVWGIMRRDSDWIPEPMIDADGPGDQDALIACADCHPSYDYCLDVLGRFTGLGGGGGAECFSIKVERDALLHDLSLHTEVRVSEGIANERAQDLLKRYQYQVVDEASDRFATYYSAPGSVLSISHGGGAHLYQV